MRPETADEPQAANEHLLKVLLLGNMAVGKTSILKRYAHKTFGPHKPTTHIDFALKVLTLPSKNRDVARLQLWDIPGQEPFGDMTQRYYREAAAAVIVIDATRVDAVEGAEEWIQDLQAKFEYKYRGNGFTFPLFIAVNKWDLASDEQKKAAQEKATALGAKYDARVFYTSAKYDSNIEAMFRILAKQCVDHTHAASNGLSCMNSVEALKALARQESTRINHWYFWNGRKKAAAINGALEKISPQSYSSTTSIETVAKESGLFGALSMHRLPFQEDKADSLKHFEALVSDLKRPEPSL